MTLRNYFLHRDIKSYHETLREKWSINGCPEIAIDTLPGIPTYVELDCKNEKEITAPIRQDSISAARGPIGLNFLQNNIRILWINYCQIWQNRIPHYSERLLRPSGRIVSPRLGLDMKDAKYGPYVNQYIDYYKVDIDDNNHPLLTFKDVDKQLDPTKDLLPFLASMKAKNLELIKKSKIKLS